MIKHLLNKLQSLLSPGAILTENQEEIQQILEDLKHQSEILEKTPLHPDMHLNKDFSAFHKFIYEQSSQIYYFIDGSKIVWKGAIEKILGFSPSEFFENEECFSTQLHEEDQKKYRLFLKAIKENPKNYVKQYRFKHRNGKFIIIEDSGKAYFNEKGSFIRIGILTDITARTRANNILKSKERNNKIIHELSLINSRDLSINDLFLTCLRIIATHTNWPFGRAISLYRGRFENKLYNSLWFASKEKYSSIYENFHEDRSLVFSPLHLELLENNAPFIFSSTASLSNIDLYAKAHQEGIKHVLLFPIHVRSQIAAIIEFYCVENDITELFAPNLIKQLGILLGNMLENKIIEDEFEKFLLAIEQNFASVVITNSSGYIVYANPRFSEITGYSREEILGKKPGFVKSGLHDKTFYTEMWQTISKGLKWQNEIINRRKDGSLFTEQVSISPLKDKEGNITHFVAVKFDISEKKKSEEELKKTKEQAELANKSKSEFLASMSHEIRTPMNAILGFAELLSLKITDEMQSSYLESIRSSGKTLLNLINDVLDLSKIEAGKMTSAMEFFDPFHMFKDVEYMFTLKAQEKGLDFKVEVDMNLPVSIESDEIRLRQILINLIGNAIKFTSTGYVKVYAKSLNNYLIDGDQYVDMLIEICDTGIGISEEFKKVMFTPFTQQEGQDNKRYGGTGLGLTITKKLVQLLKGDISVESELHKGSKFIIQLPKLRASSKAQYNIGLSTITPDKIKFQPSCILIADDVENNRNYFKGVLENTGIKILESENGIVTLELALAHKPDAIITDIKMPGMDGFELLKKIKENPDINHIPVVATTASTSIEDKNKLFKHNFDGILIKPIQVNDVYLELMRLLPHEFIQTESEEDNNEQDTEKKSISISALSDEHTHTVKRMLETDLFDIWKAFDEQQPLSDVEAFAGKCRELGQKYELGILVSYGNRLLSAINNFDIDNMLKTLQEYPKLVNTFKTINEE